MSLDDVNYEMAQLAESAREEEVELQYEEFLMQEEELLKQYDAMQRAADLEDFSPFDTVNS